MQTNEIRIFSIMNVGKQHQRAIKPEVNQLPHDIKLVEISSDESIDPWKKAGLAYKWGAWNQLVEEGYQILHRKRMNRATIDPNVRKTH